MAPLSLPHGHSSQLVQALRKALEPALSDISVDWFVPDSVEALLTPREIPALYPGDQLLGYCSLFRVDGFRPHPPGVGLGWGAGSGPGMAEALASPPNPSFPVPLCQTLLLPPGLLRDHTGPSKVTATCLLLRPSTELSCKVLPWLLPRVTKPHRQRTAPAFAMRFWSKFAHYFPQCPTEGTIRLFPITFRDRRSTVQMKSQIPTRPGTSHLILGK